MSGLEAVLKHDRRVVAAGLVLVVVLAWGYTLTGAGMGMSAFEMTRQSDHSTIFGDGAGAVPGRLWTLSQSALMLLMWWVMMIAMMLPSAAPTILLAAALNRRSSAKQAPYGSAACFTIGYLLVWALFSVLATAAQWLLQYAGQLSMALQNTGAYLNAALLIAGGLWQFSPIKQACLRHCRSPVEYLTCYRRPGNAGALLMGMGHGSYCLACCWFLMALLFIGGVMNIYWIAGLALYVMVEKLLPHGRRISQALGILLIGAGLAVLVLAD